MLIIEIKGALALFFFSFFRKKPPDSSEDLFFFFPEKGKLAEYITIDQQDDLVHG